MRFHWVHKIAKALASSDPCVTELKDIEEARKELDREHTKTHFLLSEVMVRALNDSTEATTGKRNDGKPRGAR